MKAAVVLAVALWAPEIPAETLDSFNDSGITFGTAVLPFGEAPVSAVRLHVTRSVGAPMIRKLAVYDTTAVGK